MHLLILENLQVNRKTDKVRNCFVSRYLKQISIMGLSFLKKNYIIFGQSLFVNFILIF